MAKEKTPSTKDSSPIEKTILLRLETVIENQNKATKHLSNYSKLIAKSTKRLSSHTKAMGKASTSMGYFKRVLKLTGQAVAGVTTFVTGAGKDFVTFAALTGKGTRAVQNLRAAYDSVIVGGKEMTVSLSDATKAMQTFSQQSFTQLQMAAESGTQKFVITMQNAFTQGLGDPKIAAQLTEGVTKAFGQNLDTLQQFASEINAVGGDLGKQASIMEKYEWINPTVMEKAIGTMKNAIETASGSADPAIQANLEWSKIVNELTTLFSNLRQEIVEAFGSDIASSISNIGDLLSRIIGWVKDFSTSLRAVSAGVATAISNVEIMTKNTWAKIKNWFVQGVAFIAKTMGEMLSLIPFTDFGEDLVKWSEKTSRESSEAFNKAWNTKGIRNVYQAMADEMSRTNKEQGNLKDTTDKTHDSASNVNKDILEARRRLQVAVEKSQNWNKQLNNVAGSMGQVADISRLIGGNVTVAGKSFNQLTQEMITDTIRLSKSAINAAKAGLPETEVILKNIRKRLRAAQEEAQKAQEVATRTKTKKDEEEAQKATQKLKAIEQELNAELKRRGELIDTIKNSYQSLKKALDDSTADLEGQRRIIEKQKNLAETNLEISKALYGTPALAVENLQKVVSLMEQEKQNLKAQLAIKRAVINQMVKEGVVNEEVRFIKEAELDLVNRIRKVTADQVNMLKELRDGYLDAIQAQALGAGRFSKIIISQEQNLMRGLQKGVAKRNYLLGQYGKEAAKGVAKAYRFSPGGYGNLSSLEGPQAVGTDAIAKEHESNIANKQARNISVMARQIVTSSDKNTDRIVNAISEWAYPKLKAVTPQAAAGKGTAGQTAVGEAMRTGKTPITNTVGGNAKAMRNIVGVLMKMATGLDAIEEKQDAATEPRQGRGGNRVLP